MATRKNILVIDSNDYHYHLLLKTLNNSELRVILTRAPTIEKGIYLLKSRHFDAVISENFERETDEWLPRLKKNSNGSQVVILSTLNNEKRVISAMKKGADDYLVKNKETLKSLPAFLAKTLEKSKRKSGLHTEASPTTQRFQALTKNLKNIKEMINEPSKPFVLAKDKLQVLDNEIDSLKGLIKNFIN